MVDDVPSDEQQTDASRRRLQRFNGGDMKIAELMFELIRALHPKFRTPNFNTWANDIRLMREHDKRTHEEIEEIFVWANRDHFWCTNILSPNKLRKHFDRLSIQRDRSIRAGKNETSKRASSAVDQVRAARDKRRSIIDADDNT